MSEQPHPPTRPPAPWWKSFACAFSGIGWALHTQKNLRFHALATLGVLILGFFENIVLWEWCAIWLCIALVWATELINTAIEALCDRITLQHDETIRRVKDAAAGAVLLCAIVSVIVAVLIFL